MYQDFLVEDQGCFLFTINQSYHHTYYSFTYFGRNFLIGALVCLISRSHFYLIFMTRLSAEIGVSIFLSHILQDSFDTSVIYNTSENYFATRTKQQILSVFSTLKTITPSVFFHHVQQSFCKSRPKIQKFSRIYTISVNDFLYQREPTPIQKFQSSRPSLSGRFHQQRRQQAEICLHHLLLLQPRYDLEKNTQQRGI